MSWAALIICAFFASSLAGQSQPQETIQTHYQRAQEAMGQGRYDAAAGEFLEILRLNPKLAEAHANLGVVYYTQGKYSEASRSFREALKLKPSLSKAEHFLGMSEAKSGRLQEARPILERAFKDPTNYEWRQQTGLLLIEIYSARMESDKALDILRTLQKSYPSSPEVLYI